MDQYEQKLILYIRECLARGLSKERIKVNLLLHGWRQETVDVAFSEIQKSSIPLVPTSATIKKASHLKIILKLWLRPFLLAFFGLIFFGVYTYFYLGEFSLLGISIAVAGVASLCIGTSFALSGLSYYLVFFRRMLGYRRYFGLLGYFLALIYSFMLLFVNKDKYYHGFIANLGSMDFVLGLWTMAIFTVMAAISNSFFMRKLGSSLSHTILRFGYLGYFLLILRAINLEGEAWTIWFKTFNGIPPPKLLISIFASCVILLRIMLEISLRLAKKNNGVVSTVAAKT